MNSTADPVVFDTNSLWNFAVVDRLDLLEERYGDRAAWVDTVWDEVNKSAAWESCLSDLLTAAWLGTPIALSGAGTCLVDVARIQKILAAPGNPPTKHLGEAESIHVIEHELGGHGVFVTDDMAARDLAQKRRLRVVTTPGVLAECHAMGELACPKPFELLVEMRAKDRGVKVPLSHLSICP